MSLNCVSKQLSETLLNQLTPLTPKCKICFNVLNCTSSATLNVQKVRSNGIILGCVRGVPKMRPTRGLVHLILVFRLHDDARNLTTRKTNTHTTQTRTFLGIIYRFPVPGNDILYLKKRVSSSCITITQQLPHPRPGASLPAESLPQACTEATKPNGFYRKPGVIERHLTEV